MPIAWWPWPPRRLPDPPPARRPAVEVSHPPDRLVGFKVLHGQAYRSPRDAARLVLRTRRVCRDPSNYLACVVQWDETRALVGKVSAALDLPRGIGDDPEAFLAWYRSLYVVERIKE